MKPTLILALLAGAMLFGCAPADKTEGDGKMSDGKASSGGDSKSKKSVAFVTNNASDFWTIARKGTEKAAAELPDVTVEFKMPDDGSAAKQKQILEDLVSSGVQAIAVSPVSPADQTADLNTVADKAVLFCQDSDAPDSKRACYVGTDNVAAGRMAGEEIKKALPDGGKIMVFVGKADAQNAKERYEGIQEALKGSKVTILGLKTDDTDRARAKENVTSTIAANPDVACLVGLWSYNGTQIVNGVKEAKKEGKIKIVCFDEEDEVLAGVVDGTVFSTVVQQPFEFGYQSVLMMAKVLDGDKSVIPDSKKVIVPTKAIDKSNVAEFTAKLKELRGK